jgi:hypothetical protein
MVTVHRVVYYWYSRLVLAKRRFSSLERVESGIQYYFRFGVPFSTAFDLGKTKVMLIDSPLLLSIIMHATFL